MPLPEDTLLPPEEDLPERPEEGRPEVGRLDLPPLIRPPPEERPADEEPPVLRLPPPLFLPIKTSCIYVIQLAVSAINHRKETYNLTLL